MAVNAVWTALVCFVFAALAMWLVIRHGRSNPDEHIVMLVNTLVLIASATVCVMCCRHILRLPIPPDLNNRNQCNGKGNRKGE